MGLLPMSSVQVPPWTYLVHVWCRVMRAQEEMVLLGKNTTYPRHKETLLVFDVVHFLVLFFSFFNFNHICKWLIWRCVKALELYKEKFNFNGFHLRDGLHCHFLWDNALLRAYCKLIKCSLIHLGLLGYMPINGRGQMEIDKGEQKNQPY